MLMTQLPYYTTGIYHVTGKAILVFDISGINKYFWFEGLDEDETPSFDEELDLDHANARFNIQKSSITNFKCEEVK